MYVMIQRMRTPERPEREHQAMPAPAHGYAPARSPGWAAAWGDHPPAALFPIVRHVQPHLAVSQPGDPAELEAERVAEQVTRQVDPSAAQPALSVVQRCPGSPTGPSGECLACGHTPALVPRAATEVGQGQPLPAGVRRFFEPRFGADFGAVRVHADPAAAQAARSIGALAYTVGPDSGCSPTSSRTWCSKDTARRASSGRRPAVARAVARRPALPSTLPHRSSGRSRPL